MFSKKPLSVDRIFKSIVTAIKDGTIQLTYGDAYYRQVVLWLGPKELAQYRPLLSDFRTVLKDQLDDWYARQGVDYRPVLVLAGDKEATHVTGSFEEKEIPGKL